MAEKCRGSAGREAKKVDSSLEGIETRLWLMDVDNLIDLALQFDESPMRYFTRESLQMMNYAKRHYVS